MSTQGQPIVLKIVRFILAALLLTLLLASSAFAGPPFLTDDPEPVEFRHYEFYTFGTLDRLHSQLAPGVAGHNYAVFVPAFEFNAGVAPELQLHIVVPMALSAGQDLPTTYGMGDIELGAKYRFVKEQKWFPQVGTFPMLEIASGDARRNLGNGTTWAKLPVWLQKTWRERWTSYGGAGYAINHAPGMRDHIFAGWQVQRELNKKLTLGVEWFDPGRSAVEGEGTQFLNGGGFYNFRDGFSLLFTAGHSFQGESHALAYVGLYRTWGAKEAESPERGGEARMMRPLHACAACAR